MRISSVAALLLLLCGILNAQSKTSTTVAEQFTVNRQRPYVYLQFQRVGEVAPLSGNEPSTRVWLRLVNNCRVPIIIRTSGTSEGSDPEEVGVIYDVVETPTSVGGLGVLYKPNVGESPTTVEATGSSKPTTMPTSSHVDVSSTATIFPGDAVLFSVPVNHFNEKWHIEIPFRFELPRACFKNTS